MKRIIVIVFLIGTLISWSQTVKGIVLDEQNQPLPGANIYFDGTTIATISDNNGNFSLNYEAKLNSVLVVSFIGYQSQFIQSFDAKKGLFIILKEAINKLDEVVITKEKFSRKHKMKLFKEQFLGKTKAGRKAIIENEDDIYFEYIESTKTLKAYSNKLLIINNVLLGYKITYEMIDFQVNFNTVSMSSDDVNRSFYAGLSRFEELNSNSKILKEREKCYQGSRLHFFRNLANNIWDKDNFLLFKRSFQDNPNNYFTVTKTDDGSSKVVVTNQKQSFKSVAIVNLLFNNKQQSKVIFETDTFYIDQFGNNSNINNIFFSGHIAEQKVGGLLPINYGIN